MNPNQILTAVLWVAAIGILVLFVMRRKKRKSQG
jgi:hypothetical protein